MTGLEISPGSWLLVAGLGALVGLDGVSWPQAMISRPLVAATLGGLLFGEPQLGFLAGAWLELVFARHPPFGAARTPEPGPAALVAGAAYALSGTGSFPALVSATLAGWVVAWVGSHTIKLLRAHNARRVADPEAFQGQPQEVARRHRAAMRLDAARGALIAGALFIPAVVSIRILETWWTIPVPRGAPGSLLAVAGLAMLGGAAARVLGGHREGWPAFVGGGAIGLLLAWGWA